MNALQFVKLIYQAIDHEDFPVVLGLLSSSIEWTEMFPGYQGTWLGPDAVRENVLKRLDQDWNNFVITTESFVTEGAQVVVFGTYTGTFKATGKPLTAPFVHRWEVADGKISSFRQYTDTALVQIAKAAPVFCPADLFTETR